MAVILTQRRGGAENELGRCFAALISASPRLCVERFYRPQWLRFPKREGRRVEELTFLTVREAVENRIWAASAEIEIR